MATPLLALDSVSNAFGKIRTVDEVTTVIGLKAVETTLFNFFPDLSENHQIANRATAEAYRAYVLETNLGVR